MKRITYIICICTTYLAAFPQYYYYYYDEKIPLTINSDYIYITTTESDKSHLNADIGDNFEITTISTDNSAIAVNQIEVAKANANQLFRAEIRVKNKVGEVEYLALIEQLKKLPDIVYAAPCFFTIKNNKVDISHLFHVKLKSQDDLSQLQEMAKQTKSKIIGQNKYMPLWYTLACNKNSTGNSLELSNQFYASGRFTTAEPDLFKAIILNGCPPNDQYFTDQWGLQNTGQTGGTNGIDINACAAWEITTGSPSVITAIIDNGFQRDHPDLAANVPNTGFNVSTGVDTSVIFTTVMLNIL